MQNRWFMKRQSVELTGCSGVGSRKFRTHASESEDAWKGESTSGRDKGCLKKKPV